MIQKMVGQSENTFAGRESFGGNVFNLHFHVDVLPWTSANTLDRSV